MRETAARMFRVASLCVCVAACASGASQSAASSAVTTSGEADLNAVAERYVKLVLAVGQHDPAFVDAFFGPEAWRTEAEAAGKRPLADLRAEAAALAARAGAAEVPLSDTLLALRRRFLQRQLQAVETRVRMLQGERFTFDEEAAALYDAHPPHIPESEFEKTLAELDRTIPGAGALIDRVEAYRQRFVIPRERLDTVFKAAIAEARRRTLEHVTLPAGESFDVEYVTNKSWSGYNWYKGNAHSLIQVNTDLPIFIDRAIDLAAHEGYPGHHVYNSLLEQHLARDRGWMEFTVYPLFSPESLIAEGSANYGITVAFPGEDRVRFEQRVLWPLAGLDPAEAPRYYEVQELVNRLSYAGNEAARRYLNGEIDRDAAAEWLTRYALMAPARAQQRVRFMDDYRSYVINYNLGQDLVRQFVETRARGDDERRWAAFEQLLSSPRLPSELAAAP